ncbi:MAG TPA: vitamin K epoxide reductase family protein [Streptosporangiaceae bacterium]|nr:vitamin K epoxide reductase family protein [Streptosporangiaceae bacterium]
MASPKRNRPASGQGKGGAATRSGSGGSGRNGRRATTPAAPVRTGSNGRAGGGQGKAGQNGGRGPGGQNGGRGRPGQPGRATGVQGRAATQVAERPDAGPEERFSAPAWVRWSALALSLAGLGVSIYLTIAHYTTSSILACSSKGFVDCAKVTTSSQSMVFGIFPVAVLGLAFYVFMVAVNSPWGWRMQLPVVWWARLGSVVVGMGFVLYLLYAEIIQIGNICLWCTSVHVITFLLFVLLVFAATLNSGSAARDAR